MLSSIVFALALSGSNVAFAATSTSYATRPPISTIQPSLASIYAAQATATSLSPVSNVKGQAFDRIIQIWLENTVGHIRVIFRSQSLIVMFRTLTKLLQIQICNGLQAKGFSLPTTSLQPTLPSRKFICKMDKVFAQRLTSSFSNYIAVVGGDNFGYVYFLSSRLCLSKVFLLS
jgi:hypothetical protein